MKRKKIDKIKKLDKVENWDKLENWTKLKGQDTKLEKKIQKMNFPKVEFWTKMEEHPVCSQALFERVKSGVKFESPATTRRTRGFSS